MNTLSPSRAATLRAAVDRIIPADDQSAGGVDAGVYDYLLRQLRPGGYFPERLADYEEGLGALTAFVFDRYGVALGALAPDVQDAALTAFEAHSPRFFRLLVEQAQEGYYTSPAGQSLIGWQVTA